MFLIKKINIKFLVFGSLLALVIGLLIKNILFFSSVDNKIETFSVDKQINFTEFVPQKTQVSNSSQNFDYDLIGVKLGVINSSVFVSKGGKQFDVQLNDFLENKYKLVSVSNEEIIFEYNNKKIILKNKFNNNE
jgi:hypothetical protein